MNMCRLINSRGTFGTWNFLKFSYNNGLIFRKKCYKFSDVKSEIYVIVYNIWEFDVL